MELRVVLFFFYISFIHIILIVIICQNLPITRTQLVGRSVIISLKGGKFHSHAPIGAIAIFDIGINNI